MSDPYHPAAPAAPTRPSSVTISSYLLLLVAALFAIGAIAGLATLGTAADVYREAYEGTSAEGAEAFVTVVGAVGAVVQLLFAAAFVVLALMNNRGRNGSRITTWVLGGLGICCTGINLSSSALNGMSGGSTGDLPDPAEIQRRLSEELPGWAEPLSLATNVIALLALLVAIVLLALPASNPFFRKQKVGWEPPVPGTPYPGQTGTTPGYAPSGDPGYPPVPPATPGGDPGYPPVPPAGQPPAGPPPGDAPGQDDQSPPPAR